MAKDTKFARLFVYVILAMFAIMCLCGCAAEAADYMVISNIAAITKRTDVRYKVEDGGIEMADDITGAVIYGNVVDVTKTDASGKFGWVSFNGAKGWLRMAALSKMPAYTKLAPEPFQIVKDKPQLSLTPGSKPVALDLLAGESSPGVGLLKDKNGTEWTLLRFESQSNGSQRFAWTKSSNLLRLSAYQPDFHKVPAEMVPASMRGYDKNPVKISNKIMKSVVKNGFAADASPLLPERIEVDDMADAYSCNVDNKYANAPKFITSDLFLHSFHLVFSHGLERIEKHVLAPNLEKMLSASLVRLSVLEKKNSNAGLTPAFTAARDFLTVPYLLLKPDAKVPASNTVKTEVERIVKATEITKSPISGKEEDYTFYKPRSHYKSSELLRRYFRAMAFLGGMPVLLDKNSADYRRNVALTSLLCEVFADENLRRQWNAIRDPLAYLVGEADDPSIAEFAPVVKKDLCGDLGKLTDDALLDKLGGELLAATPKQQIIDRPASEINMTRKERITESCGFRLMGRSFVLDAWTFSLLTSEPVSMPSTPRNLPKAEDFMAILGSKTADRYLDADRKKHTAYDKVQKQIKKSAESYFSAGGKNVYADCMSALKLVFTEKGSRQFFFNAPLWDVKKLVTGLASWTELKHDTVLYAKQSYAEMGDGGEYFTEPFAPPVPKGYVEPVPQVFGAICNSLGRMKGLISKYKLEAKNDGGTRAKIEALSECTALYRDIAAKEVKEQLLDAKDFETIRNIGSYINQNLLLDGGYTDPDDQQVKDKLKMALVTDVATDMLDKRVLQVATGTPRRLFVFVDDKSAGPRLTVGYMYSFYEFARPLSEGRMTDEEWKKMAYDKKAQQSLDNMMPSWSSQLFVH